MVWSVPRHTRARGGGICIGASIKSLRMEIESPPRLLQREMDLDRESVRRKLPYDLDELARETGALRRRRAVKCAEQMLWMALMYSGLVGSLRATSALGEETGDFDINDTSVLYRLKNSVGFLTAILNHLLLGSSKHLAAKGTRRRVCLQDATVVSIPGSKGGDFRIHAAYVPGQGLSSFELTSIKGAEALERSEYNPGDIVIADQGLTRSRDIHHVQSVGAYCLLRACLTNLRLQDASGKKLVPSDLLDLADKGVSSVDVYVPHVGTEKPVQARLVMGRLPPEQAGRAREKLKKRLSKKQKTPSELTLRLAGYVVLLTTVPESELSDEEILSTYRIRWQIELFFKRCKSLLGMDELAATGNLAKSWLLGKLIIAALIDRAIVKIHQAAAGNYKVATDNLWRLTELCHLELKAAIIGVGREHPQFAEASLERIVEAPRKRKTAASKLEDLYGKLNPQAGTTRG